MSNVNLSDQPTKKPIGALPINVPQTTKKPYILGGMRINVPQSNPFGPNLPSKCYGKKPCKSFDGCKWGKPTASTKAGCYETQWYEKGWRDANAALLGPYQKKTTKAAPAKKKATKAAPAKRKATKATKTAPTKKKVIRVPAYKKKQALSYVQKRHPTHVEKLTKKVNRKKPGCAKGTVRRYTVHATKVRSRCWKTCPKEKTFEPKKRRCVKR